MSIDGKNFKTIIEGKDVVVVGGGPAGIGAAIAASRAGCSTILVERYQYLGGMLTGSLIGSWMAKWRSHKGRKSIVSPETNYSNVQTIKGIAQEMIDRLMKIGAAYGEPGKASMSVLGDPEIMKFVLDEMVLEAGVELMLDTNFCDLLLEGQLIKGVIVANKSGIHLIKSKIFIDASGDGDLAALAGIPYVKGRESDGRTMPVSLAFVLGNVNLERTIEYLKDKPGELDMGTYEDAKRLYHEGKPIDLLGFRELLNRAHENGDFPLASGAKNPIPIFCIMPVLKDGKYIKNMTLHIIDMAYNVDATDASQLTASYIAVRKRLVVLLSVIKKYIPGYENSFLVYSGSQLGVRESRRFIGEYFLTKDDLLASKKFDDAIASCGGTMNIHSEVGGTVREVSGGRVYDVIEEPFQIPYRCLISKKIDNLLIAGRCISIDRPALGSLRSTSVCMALGQAAGTGAAISVETGKNPRKIDIKRLRQDLLNQNVMIAD
ncbi:MAG: FAD-dependent oxidoreductase [Eubacteriales bacterium]